MFYEFPSLPSYQKNTPVVNDRFLKINAVVYCVFTIYLLKMSLRIFFLTYIGLIFVCQYSYAFDKDIITGDWKFKYGDDITSSDVKIDDLNWDNVKLGDLLPQNSNRDIVGWYRVYFAAHIDISEQYSLIIENLRLSDETWINGIRVGGLGNFEQNWHFKHNNPQSLIRKYDLPAGFLNYENNLLAIKVSTGFGDAVGAAFPGGIGLGSGNIFLAELTHSNHYHHNKIVKTSSIDTFFLTMSLIELFILIFLIRNSVSNASEFKWLLITSVCLFIMGFGQDFFYIHNFSFINTNLLFILSLLLTPLVLVMYFESQFNCVIKQYGLALIVVFLISCVLIIYPNTNSQVKQYCWYIWMIMALSFVIYSLYFAILAVIRGRIGSIAQLIALITFMLLSLIHFFSKELWEHRNIQIGNLLYRYLILFAYFQKIRHIRLDFKQLSQRIVSIVDDINAKIARELHDGIGQHLASMKLHLKLFASNFNKHELQNLETIEKELQNSTLGLRQLITGLHPTIIEQYSVFESLNKEKSRMQNVYDINIDLQCKSDSDDIILSNNIKLNIFRIFQECTNNAIQHGRATTITVTLLIKKDYLIMNIIDDGHGFETSFKKIPSEDNGFGFISLNERVSLLNGEIDFKSQKKIGTIVKITLPLDNN